MSYLATAKFYHGKAKEAEGEEREEYLRLAAQNERYHAEKVAGAEDKAQQQEDRRRRAEEEETRKRRRLDEARVEAELETEERRVRENREILQRTEGIPHQVDPDLPNQTHPAKLFRIVHLLEENEWMKELWPWIVVSGTARITHRVYDRYMRTFELTSDPLNRVRLLEVMDRLNLPFKVTIQEILEDTISPFFDLEPKEQIYRANYNRRSTDRRALDEVHLEWETIFAVLREAFRGWSKLVWIVYSRRSETGMRYHIRIRNTDGSCPLVSRVRFLAFCERVTLKFAERVAVPPRDWLGWDLDPLRQRQMRFSNSIKVFKTDNPTVERITGVAADLKRYVPKGAWIVEAGQVLGEAALPYQLTSSKAASSNCFAEGRPIIPQRNIDREVFDIVNEYQVWVAQLPNFAIPLHNHLKPSTFSWNWKPSIGLDKALTAVPYGEYGPDAWEPIARRYIRVVRTGQIRVAVLTRRPPNFDSLDAEGAKLKPTSEFYVEWLEQSKFKATYDGWWYKSGKAKITFAQCVIERHWCDAEFAIWSHVPVEYPDVAFFNQWMGPAYTPNASIAWVMEHRDEAKLAVRMFLEHLKVGLCGGDSEDLPLNVRRYNMWCFSALLHFAQALLVNPFDRHIWEFIVMIQGPPGCGKGTFFKVLQALVGNHMTTRILGSDNAERQATQFNAVFNNLLVLLDEISYMNSALLSNLKPLSTEPDSAFEAKYGANQKMQAITRLLILFNELASLPKLDKGERRLIVLEGKNHPQKREFFDRYYKLLQQEGGYHAIALYLYTLVHNNAFFAAMDGAPMVGPLKSAMLAGSSPVLRVLYENTNGGWFGHHAILFPFKYDDSYLNVREKTAWHIHLDAIQMELSSVNWWVWEELGEGFTAEWPPFIPVASLFRALNPGRSAREADLKKIEIDITETLKSEWPAYVQRTWPNHPYYRDLCPVVDLTTLMETVRTNCCVLQDGAWIHRGCPPNCDCGRPGFETKVMGWTPWQGKTEWQPLAGKVVLLPKKDEAKNFLAWMFPGVSEIDRVHFPHHWQPDRFDAFVDALGGASEARPIDEDDEAVYFGLRSVLSADIQDRS